MSWECPICGRSEGELFSTAVDRFRGRLDREFRILRCPDCGHGWTEPAPSREEIPSLYPEAYQGDVRRAVDDFLSGRLQKSRSWRHETEKVRLVESLRRGGRILDIGCGDGKFLWALSGDRWDRTGVEFSSRTVEVVRSRIPGIRFLCGSIENCELPDGAFDVVTLWHVLEHLPDPVSSLRTIARLLRPRGWVVVSLPNLDSLQARVFRRHWYAFDDVPRHLHHFSAASLESALRDAGFVAMGRRYFSRRVAFHCLKHSLVNWSEDRFGNRIPYYALKWLLWGMMGAEAISGRYGIVTVPARPAENNDGKRLKQSVRQS